MIINTHKLNKIHLIFSYFFIIWKIKSTFSYINLKISGNGNIYSNNYLGNKPDIIIINNITNYTDNDVRYAYNLDCSENIIDNITLIWNNPLTSTPNIVCFRIIEDLK